MRMQGVRSKEQRATLAVLLAEKRQAHCVVLPNAVAPNRRRIAAVGSGSGTGVCGLLAFS